MNTFIEMLNLCGQRASEVACAMFWQSSLLIAMVGIVDFVLRRRLRPAVRYALWLVVLAKLLLPPSLALPTGVGWWLNSTTTVANQPRFVVAEQRPIATDVVPSQAPQLSQIPEPTSVLLSAAGWGLMACSAIALALLALVMARWLQVSQHIRRAAPAPESIYHLLSAACRITGVHRNVHLRLTQSPMSPSICGLFRPVILLPRLLTEQLSAEQLQAVLVHELIHLRRGDLWINCAQATLQIVYWWHPLVWLANARIRRVREEAVDDAVIHALAENADAYAPTLLEVAKLAFTPRMASLGLMSILEPGSALAQRIKRLVNATTPRKAGLTILSILGVTAFAAFALPMGNPPPVEFNKEPSRQPGPRGDSMVRIAKPQAPAAAETNVASNPVAPVASAHSNVLNVPVTLPVAQIIQSNSIASSEAPADPLAQKIYKVDPKVFVPNLKTAVDASKPRVKVEAHFVQLSGFDPTLEESGSPLRVLPSNLLTNAHETEAAAKLRAMFHPPEILRLVTCANPTVTNILDQAQAQALLAKVTKQSGTDVLTPQPFTSPDGRKMRITVQDILTIITGVETNVATGADGSPKLSVSYPTEQIRFGPVLDILPKIEKDGQTVTLTIDASVTEFLDYDNPGKPSTFEVKGASPLKYKQPLPRLRFLQMTAQASVKDGQTLLLGGPISYNTAKTVDTVPVLSGIPLVGKLFRREHKAQVQSHLFILITPTIVDPADHGVYSTTKAN